MTTRRPAQPGHIPALDGVRGMAVLMVMLLHFTSAGLPPTPPGMFVRHVFMAGWSGVDLFFVLSGFLITGILYDARNDRGYFRNFYARRALRIFPLYYGFLAAYLWLLPVLHPFTRAMKEMAAYQGWLWAYGTNVLMAWKGDWYFEVHWMELGHFWSLAVEEQFYLAWPLVVFLASRRALIRVCTGSILAAAVLRILLVTNGVNEFAIGMLTITRFDSLAAGGLVAVLVRGEPAWLRRSARYGTPALGLVILAISVWRGKWDAVDPVVQTIGFTLLALFFAGLLVLLVTSRSPSRLRSFFASPFLVWFGTYSYAMYVFHVAFRPVLRRLLLEPLSDELASPYLAVAIFAVLAIAVSAGAAFASWHVYEKHFLRLKRYFTTHRVEPMPAPMPVLSHPDPVVSR